MQTAIKEEVLPPAVITEILSANPQSAKSEQVIQILNERITPLTDEQKNQIDQGYYIIGARESLESKLAGHRSDYSRALNGILRHYKNDSLNPQARDSVIFYLSNELNPTARYNLAFEYLDNNDSANAAAVLNSITTEFSLNTQEMQEYDNYLSYFNIFRQVKNGHYPISELTGSQKQSLLDIASGSNGRTGVHARNMLIAANVLEYLEPYILPDPGQQPSRSIGSKIDETCQHNLLKVYPNPAFKYVILEYELQKFAEDGVIIISDISGKSIRTIPLVKAMDWLVTDIADFPSGTYLSSLKTGIKILSSQKFIVIK